MKTIVIYKSKTGFTENYAKWIGEELKCEVKGIKEVDLNTLSNYDLVIYGGNIFGGQINGIQEIQKVSVKKLVVFGVGFTETEDYVNTVKEANHLHNIPCFYMVGGFHPKKMGFMAKLMVKAVTKKTVTETDHSDKKYIKPLISYVKEMCMQ